MSGCADPSENAHLASVLQKARSIGFPKDRIEHSVARGLGKCTGTLTHATYELYGPGRVAFVVSTACDSRNRIVANLRYWAAKQGGSLVRADSFEFLFEKVVQIELEVAADVIEEVVLEAATSAGGHDVRFGPGVAIVSFKGEVPRSARAELERFGLKTKSVETRRVPRVSVLVEGANRVNEFEDALEELKRMDGVDSVLHNAVLLPESSSRVE